MVWIKNIFIVIPLYSDLDMVHTMKWFFFKIWMKKVM